MVPGFIGPGILHAYNATNLGDELYNSNQAAGSRDTLDAWLKFSVPVVANGEVFVASDSELTIYGLLPNPPGGSMADAAISASVSLAGGPSTPAPATITSEKGIISSPTAFSDASKSLDPYFVGAQAPNGFSSNLSIGVVPAQPGSVPRGPLFVAKAKPAVTNAVVGQPLVNLRARVVNDIGSVGRLHGENGGGSVGKSGMIDRPLGSRLGSAPKRVDNPSDTKPSGSPLRCVVLQVSFTPTARRPVDPGLLKAMGDAIAHRGPDAEGFWTEPGVGLAHRRLSIIDLEGGDQPIGNEDGSIQVVFNGEIYNYQELRRRLEGRGHRFRTKSDTEVLVHLYEEHGVGSGRAAARHVRLRPLGPEPEGAGAGPRPPGPQAALHLS